MPKTLWPVTGETQTPSPEPSQFHRQTLLLVPVLTQLQLPLAAPRVQGKQRTHLPHPHAPILQPRPVPHAKKSPFKGGHVPRGRLTHEYSHQPLANWKSHGRAHVKQALQAQEQLPSPSQCRSVHPIKGNFYHP